MLPAHQSASGTSELFFIFIFVRKLDACLECNYFPCMLKAHSEVDALTGAAVHGTCMP